jgi:hypothetical protein
MARTFPSSLNNYDFKEAGEERVFNILKNLSDDCRVWYEVVLGVKSRKPDFLVVDPNRGIIILEVKDWGKSTILAASPTTVRIKSSHGKHVDQKNPIRKCGVYLAEATEVLELEPVLIGRHDKLLCPVDYFVVFPNLTEKEFQDLELSRYLDAGHIIFRKDVRNQTSFVNRMYSRLPSLPQPLTPDMLVAIRRRLRDEVTIDSPGGTEGLLPGILPEGRIQLADELVPDVFAIDVEQEGLAKDLGEGPRLMRGIAGTGKTLIMLMRAKLLASNAEAQGRNLRILVLCWNVSLANYMRQAFTSINIPLKSRVHTDIFFREGVPVLHFAEFARQLVGRHHEVPRFPRSSDEDFEAKVTERLIGLEIADYEKYDVIIVDEAQDFRDEWLKFLFHKMLRGDDPKSKSFILAADDAQRVYKSRNFSWAALGIPMIGEKRSRILRKIYRNSARVWGFAAFLLRDIAPFYDENPDLRFSPKRGVDPRLVECDSLRRQIEVCVEEVQNVGNSGYSWRNVLIIYKRARTSQGFRLIDHLLRRLDEERVPYEWITESMDSKNTFRWEHDSVKISTAVSAKGLDAPKVIVLNAESFGVDPEGEYDDTKLMYVALTRAREELIVLHTGQGGIVPELQRCQELYGKTRPRLIEFEKEASKHVI